MHTELKRAAIAAGRVVAELAVVDRKGAVPLEVDCAAFIAVAARSVGTCGIERERAVGNRDGRVGRKSFDGQAAAAHAGRSRHHVAGDPHGLQREVLVAIQDGTAVGTRH